MLTPLPRDSTDTNIQIQNPGNTLVIVESRMQLTTNKCNYEY